MTAPLNLLIASRVRLYRKNAQLSRRALGQLTDISERYLAQLEAGKANISIALLQRICRALDVPLTQIVKCQGDEGIDPRLSSFIANLNGKSQGRALKLLQSHFANLPEPGKSGIALVGIRGCGKTTLGRLLAEKTTMKFVGLSKEIVKTSGMSIAEITELGGLDAYRRHELQVLKNLIESEHPVILEVSGGVADSAPAFELLIQNFNTVFVKASAHEHFDRVTAQHDTRLMRDRENSIRDIKNMLAKRKASFERVQDVLDTSGKSVEASARELFVIARRYANSLVNHPSISPTSI